MAKDRREKGSTKGEVGKVTGGVESRGLAASNAICRRGDAPEGCLPRYIYSRSAARAADSISTPEYSDRIFFVSADS